LAGLAESGVRFAVLHGYEHLETDSISDVDTVVDEDPRVILRKAEGHWRERGLFPIITWPYDIGATMTLFLATSDAAGGVQLDMLHDPKGVGKYGIQSAAMLRHVEQRPLAPTVDRAARLVYLWQKRVAKDQAERLDSLREEAIGVDPATLEATAREITGSPEPAWGLLGGRILSKPRPQPSGTASLSRLVGRLRHPIGVWVHVSHDYVGDELTRRLAGHLVVVRRGDLPSWMRQWWWYPVSVAPVRYRAGVYISVGQAHGFALAPDVVIDGSNVERSAEELVEAMSRRVMTCVS
jgi:hypothetical protein